VLPGRPGHGLLADGKDSKEYLPEETILYGCYVYFISTHYYSEKSFIFKAILRPFPEQGA
jgi:hypothetical protein